MPQHCTSWRGELRSTALDITSPPFSCNIASPVRQAQPALEMARLLACRTRLHTAPDCGAPFSRCFLPGLLCHHPRPTFSQRAQAPRLRIHEFQSDTGPLTPAVCGGSEHCDWHPPISNWLSPPDADLPRTGRRAVRRSGSSSAHGPVVWRAWQESQLSCLDSQ